MKNNIEKAKELIENNTYNPNDRLNYVFEDIALKAIDLASKPNWIDAEKHKPNAYEKGNWDGLRTDYMLIHTISGNITKARAYIGFLDGSDFCDWYAENDFEIHEKVTHFMNLPESPIF